MYCSAVILYNDTTFNKRVVLLKPVPNAMRQRKKVIFQKAAAMANFHLGVELAIANALKI